MRATQKHVTQIIRLAESIHHIHPRDVLADFAELWATAFLSTVEIAQRNELITRFQALHDKYDLRYRGVFKSMLDELEHALTIEPVDVMGQVFMQIGSPNQARGQVFTPDSLCEAMAKVQVGDGVALGRLIEERGFITVNDPACGSGATLIAFAKQMREQGMNYQQHMHATAVDVDIRAVHLAYLQLTLLHIPAKVVHGNSLTVNAWSQWHTPAHAMGLFTSKLRRGYALDSALGRKEIGKDFVETAGSSQAGMSPVPADSITKWHDPKNQLMLGLPLESTR